MDHDDSLAPTIKGACERQKVKKHDGGGTSNKASEFASLSFSPI